MIKRILAGILLACILPAAFGFTTLDGTWQWETGGTAIQVVPFLGGFLRGSLVFYGTAIGCLIMMQLASIAFNADEIDVIKFVKLKRWKLL